MKRSYSIEPRDHHAAVSFHAYEQVIVQVLLVLLWRILVLRTPVAMVVFLDGREDCLPFLSRVPVTQDLRNRVERGSGKRPSECCSAVRAGYGGPPEC